MRALIHAPYFIRNVRFRGVGFNGDVVRCALMHMMRTMFTITPEKLLRLMTFSSYFG